jgi:hypothetical protein
VKKNKETKRNKELILSQQTFFDTFPAIREIREIITEKSVQIKNNGISFIIEGTLFHVCLYI